jgi:hypothetical protein
MSGYDDEADDPGVPDYEPDERPRRSPIAYAKERVRTPAVVMLVFAILSLVGVPMGAINFITLPKAIQQQRDQVDRDPNMPPAQKQQVKGFLDMYEEIIMITLPFTLLLQFTVGVLSVIGSLKMLNVRSYRWAMTAAILNIVSIGHGCCFLTLFVGIWALMVLMNDRVKAGYAAARRKQQGNEQDQNPDDEHDRYQS